MSVKVKDTDRGLKKFLAGFEELKGLEARVGIQGPEAVAPHDEESGLTTAEIGAVHEFGAPSVGIPQRSFLRATFDEKRDEVFQTLKAGMEKAASGKGGKGGKGGNYRYALKVAAEKLRTAVIDRIDSHIPPPLEQATIDRKGGETTPLLDKGIMKGAISAVVVKK